MNGDPVSAEQPWPYKGRDESKAFLYEIVANKMSSIDVDKVTSQSVRPVSEVRIQRSCYFLK